MVDTEPPEAPANGASTEIFVPFQGSKRQRRPSVRLGDIGEQPAAIPYEPYVRRSKHWKLPPSSFGSADDLKPRHHPPSKDHRDAPPDFPPSPPPEDRALVPVDENPESFAVAIRRGSRDGKAKRGSGVPAVARRSRSSWASKVDEGAEGTDLKSSGGDDAGGEDYREFDDLRQENSESSSDRTAAAARVSDSSEGGHAANAAEGETDGGDWNKQDEWCRSLEDGGVRSWLNRLGLRRYAPVFEIHEVDDEVLPMLTLEDLKDMGINAVGSRRKMYYAIQKLRKGFA